MSPDLGGGTDDALLGWSLMSCGEEIAISFVVVYQRASDYLLVFESFNSGSFNEFPLSYPLAILFTFL